MHRNDIAIYLRAEVREALAELTERWGVNRSQAIVRAVLAAAAKGSPEPIITTVDSSKGATSDQ